MRSRGYVRATLRSIHSREEIEIRFYTVPKIPPVTVPKDPNAIFRNPFVQDKTPIADSQLGGRLDILLGSLDIIRCSKGDPKLSKESCIAACPTIFGWTFTAPMDSQQSQPILKVQTKEDNLHGSLQILWELEKMPDEIHLSSDDELALSHFDDTHTRREEGRYAVKLPWKQHPPELGASRNMAVRRFGQNERLLQCKGQLEKFREVLEEYTTLDHSKRVPAAQLSAPNYYLPAHGVSKGASTMTKLRAVFDSSAHTSTGISLNDCLLTGPNSPSFQTSSFALDVMP